MERDGALRRLAEARVGHLASADAGGIPHLAPVVFAMEGETAYWVVDQKPKRSRDIKRLANIRANPNVELAVDHYEESWDQLWWVRARGHARILEAGPETEKALGLLRAKYPQYEDQPPEGPVVAVEISHLSWWQGGHPRLWG